jgi:hypothetical protein
MPIEFFLEKAVEYYPVVAGYFVVIAVVVYVTVKIHTFYMRTQRTNDNFPRMERLLNRMSNGLDSLNRALMEKKITSQSHYAREDTG